MKYILLLLLIPISSYAIDWECIDRQDDYFKDCILERTRTPEGWLLKFTTANSHDSYTYIQDESHLWLKK